MSKRPPEDDSFINKILKEFDASIDDVDVESKMAMKDALRESIQMWFPHIGLEPDIEIFDGEKQSFVEGTEDTSEDIEGQKESIRSQLQVLADDEDLLNEEDNFPNVQVRVLSPQDLIGGTHNLFGLGTDEKPPLPKRGKIVLDVGEKRPLVQRMQVSTYRLTCEQGKMVVRTEQEQYELRSGQSMDMDAMKIEIEAIDTTTGWYQSI